MHCPLCQFGFDEKTACHGCGLTRHCTMVKCPNCGYEYVESSATVNFLKKIISWGKKFWKTNQKT